MYFFLIKVTFSGLRFSSGWDILISRNAHFFFCRNPAVLLTAAAQVRVRKMEGLDELSWGELEGQDYKLEPFKGRLASLKQAWDDGTFDRWVGGVEVVEIDPARVPYPVHNSAGETQSIN